MTEPRPLTPVSEAQLLLNRHEPWSTDDGAFLESEDVQILIEAQPLDADRTRGNGHAPSAVDVLITLRSRRRPAALRDLAIELVATDGHVVVGRLGARGQARFRELPSGRWRTRLGAAAAGDGTVTGPRTSADETVGGAVPGAVPGAASGAAVLPFRRISRVLADAAASGSRAVRDALTSADEQVVTAVEETDEGRLVATVTTAEAEGIVRLRWSLVGAEPTGVRTLVTPLAQRGPSGGGIAKYDLGPVVEATAVDLAPAEWADPAELDESAVRAAFDLVLYGSAVRAWEEFVDSERCPGHLRPLIAEALGQQ
jgi:hypothetical protein